ncbi:hypothetical protein ALNOE001_01000 [Candidatus Methanobinarius endosymbioticus]|uniref:Right handed beta helix domain-containing protein n=1 Tax=Candidatus Methanobinarius endosymbioticus TaxID=2006182 RepID=A0A366MF62_9EURY|nr:hypothetical protein ALNOE001_01000 [Candidatus Methanobinarius endosymbioticus]
MIYSSRYKITIQNNNITTTQTAINITRVYNMRENKIINNSIQTINGHGIYVYSDEDLKYNSFSGNNISANGNGFNGIFIDSVDGVFECIFDSNQIITYGTNYHGIIYV